MAVIHIFGASGSGTTTLAKAIGNRFSYKTLDSDDYFWLPTDPPFTRTRKSEERMQLMQKDMCDCKNIVISGSLCGWGDELLSSFDLAIRLITPTDVRLERIKEREFKRFGERIKSGGDMHKTHEDFLIFASQYDLGDINMRSKLCHDEWEKSLSCKLIKLDGCKKTNALIQEIRNTISLN